MEVGHDLNILVGTFNMGNAKPIKSELDTFISRNADIVIIGLQESTWMEAVGGIITDIQGANKEDAKKVGTVKRVSVTNTNAFEPCVRHLKQVVAETLGSAYFEVTIYPSF